MSSQLVFASIGPLKAPTWSFSPPMTATLLAKKRACGCTYGQSSCNEGALLLWLLMMAGQYGVCDERPRWAPGESVHHTLGSHKYHPCNFMPLIIIAHCSSEHCSSTHSLFFPSWAAVLTGQTHLLLCSHTNTHTQTHTHRHTHKYKYGHDHLLYSLTRSLHLWSTYTHFNLYFLMFCLPGPVMSFLISSSLIFC